MNNKRIPLLPYLLECGYRELKGNPSVEREIFIRFKLPIANFYIDISIGYKKRIVKN